MRTDCTRSRGAFASADAELLGDEPAEAEPDAPAPLAAAVSSEPVISTCWFTWDPRS